MTKRIRGGSGLGDSIYIRPISEYFIRQGHRVTVCSNWPDVFIGSGARVEPFSREKIDVLAHYTRGKTDERTTQWQDVCIAAKVPPMPLRFAWSVQNADLVAGIQERARGRPVILVHGGRPPMGRSDGYGRELLPERGALDAAIEALRDCLTVRIGTGRVEYPLYAEIDLWDRTKVSDLIDLAWSCYGIVGPCSFCIPLAEAFAKPLLAVWSARGLAVHQRFINSITPHKVLSGERSRYVIDSWSSERIAGISRQAFNRQECYA